MSMGLRQNKCRICLKAPIITMLYLKKSYENDRRYTKKTTVESWESKNENKTEEEILA